VHDPGSVCRRESFSDLDGNVEGGLNRHAGSVDHIAKSLALDKLANNKVRLVADAYLVNYENVRVVKRRCGLGLADESLEMGIVLSESFVEDLDRDPVLLAVAVAVGACPLTPLYRGVPTTSQGQVDAMCVRVP